MTTTIALAGKGGVGKTTVAAMVIKYLADFPEPLNPVNRTSLFRGRSALIFFRLCILAPRMRIYLGSMFVN